MGSEFVGGLSAILLTLLLACTVIYRLGPPRAVEPDAPPMVFSSGRALRHIEAIARVPRPVGSVEHDSAGVYIRDTLAATGVSPSVQETPGVTNILARLEGSARGRAVLIVGHYDTVRESPGAADDASAVAVMLETLRALKAGPPLANDVIFLFSDAEEVGSLGAKAFVYRHPWAADVAVVLNFEARGSSGPSVMFETNEENGWVIDQLAAGAPRPVANSLAYQVYKLLPNDTDLTVFKEAGFAGMNFAFMDGAANYHTALDTPANMDHGSLQHHGSNALALVRRLGNSDLAEVRSPDVVYFDLLGATLVSYPEGWVLPLAGLCAAAFAAVTMLGLRRGRLTLGGVAVGFAALLGSVLGALVAATLCGWALRSRRGGAASGDLEMFLYALLTIPVSAFFRLKLGRRVRAEELMMGGALWWLALTVLTSLFLRGGSYLFMWPSLLGLAALAVVFAAKDREPFSPKHQVVLVLGALPSVILLAPAVYLSCLALTHNSPFYVLLVVAASALILSALTPQLRPIAALSRAEG
ncbi:MAG: M20/M25/M40 family metallo-hydrolase [Acidobacteria bacterium]|nr:M20/M25/M40 family metallo-hydrolase [Acidobacteriota bacterium]